MNELNLDENILLFQDLVASIKSSDANTQFHRAIWAAFLGYFEDSGVDFDNPSSSFTSILPPHLASFPYNQKVYLNVISQALVDYGFDEDFAADFVETDYYFSLAVQLHYLDLDADSHPNVVERDLSFGFVDLRAKRKPPLYIPLMQWVSNNRSSSTSISDDEYEFANESTIVSSSSYSEDDFYDEHYLSSEDKEKEGCPPDFWEDHQPQ